MMALPRLAITVVTVAGTGKVYLADPSLKRATASVIFEWSDFNHRWDGWAAVISG